MSGELRMLLHNIWDESDVRVTTGTPVPTLPITNTQVYGRSKTAVIQPAAGVSVIEFDCPELTLTSGLVLYRHWLSNISTWRLELFDEPNLTGTCVYDSGVQECVLTKTLGDLDWLVDPLVASTFDNWPHKFSQMWFEGIFHQSGRITITDPEARDGVHEIDRIYLGRVFTPTFNFSYGHEHAWQSPDTAKRTAAGSQFASQRILTRRLSFSLDYLSDLERPHLSTAIQRVGMSRDFFISMFPGWGGQKEIDYAMSVKFTELPAISGSAFDNYTTAINVTEA